MLLINFCYAYPYRVLGKYYNHHKRPIWKYADTFTFWGFLIPFSIYLQQFHTYMWMYAHISISSRFYVPAAHFWCFSEDFGMYVCVWGSEQDSDRSIHFIELPFVEYLLAAVKRTVVSLEEIDWRVMYLFFLLIIQLQ